jgi:hypothetical protein
MLDEKWGEKMIKTSRLSSFYFLFCSIWKTGLSGWFGPDRTSIFCFPVMFYLEKPDYLILQTGSSILGLTEPLSSLYQIYFLWT